MKKIFQKKGIALILLSLILLNTLPQTLCAFIMYITNDFLTPNTITIINIISYLATYIIFAIGLSNFFDNKNIKGIIKSIPLAIGYLFIIIFDYLLGVNALDTKLWISIMHLVIDSLLLTIIIIITIYNISGKKLDLKIYKIVLLVLVGTIIHIMPELVSGLFQTIAMNNLFIQSLLCGIIYGLLLWILLVFYFSFISKRLTKEFKNPLKDYIYAAILLVLFIIVLVINNSGKIDKTETIGDMIGYSLASGDYAFDEMEILTAKSFYDDAKEFKCAYEYAIDSSADVSDCTGDLIELFKTLNTADAAEILKAKVNNKDVNYYDLEALMKLMQDRDDGDIKKVTKYLISQMHFTRTTILPYDLDYNDQIKLKEILSKYDKHILVRKYIEVYEEWLNQGELNSSVINVATRLAREYPEEISFQANAIDFYVSSPINLTGDRAIVDNFVNLTKDEVLTRSNDDIISYKTYITIAYQACNANDKAISFLEDFKPDLISEDLGSLLLVSYKKSGKHKLAEKMALKLLDMNEYNVDALSYLAIYRLQSDPDESITYAKKLAKIIRDKKEGYLKADIVLGVYRTYLTGYYESPDSTFCPYKNFYKDMTDEQKDEIKNDDILNMYFVGRGLKEENLSIINKTIEKYDYISYAYYYRAVYEMSIEDYESAVSDLEKAISLGNTDPFFYSELGFAYEGVGNLQKSLEAFEIASAQVDNLGLGSLTYNYNNIHNYFNVYINNAKHAMYESEDDHDE